MPLIIQINAKSSCTLTNHTYFGYKINPFKNAHGIMSRLPKTNRKNMMSAIKENNTLVIKLFTLTVYFGQYF